MSTIRDEFFTQAPTKIFQQAQQFSKTLDHRMPLPKHISKSVVVKSKAKQQTDNIDFAIRQAEYQQFLYREKEGIDQQTREKFRRQLERGDEKVANNLKEKQKKINKKNQDYEKHAKEVFRKHEEEEKHKRTREREESTKLREQLKEFYEKQEERKSTNERLQGAVDKINRIHKENEQFSRRAEENLNKQLNRNNKFGERLMRKQRVLSEANQRKPDIYDNSVEILQHKRHRFIQTCGKNQDIHLSAAVKHSKTIADWRKKKGEETKRNLDRWKENKTRIQYERAEIPSKCVNILDKTSKASFRRTASTFRDSANRFEEIVQENKRAIKEEDERKKDDIMDIHLDMTLRNYSTSKVTDKMHSMRHQARKIAYDFL